MRHAKLSCSGSKIWLACPPSVVLGDQFPDTPSDASREGTFAHDLAEHRLLVSLNRLPHYVSESNIPEFANWYSKESSDYIDEYVQRCMNAFHDAGPGAVCYTERKLPTSAWVPDGFGTVDFIIIGADGCMTVIDLKFGKGVPVDAVDNPQLRLYALGAVQEFGHLFYLEEVTMIIDQPRLNSRTIDSIAVVDLIKWADTIVAPAAALASKGEGKFSPGEHCRFCKARHACRARADQVTGLAAMEFKPPSLLSDGEVAQVLNLADQLTAWASDVRAHAQRRVEAGNQLPGWKLVEGRSNRVITDMDSIAQRLKVAGVDEALIYERSLYPLTTLEKVVGKKAFAELAGDLIAKPPGRATLVPDSDKRPAIVGRADAAADFSTATQEN
jgi:hypothetical protein